VVSLLNGDGGILTYGVRSNGMIYGERINRREQDVLTVSSVDGAIKRIIPCVECELYSINFSDVAGVPSLDRYDYHNIFKVVVIKVARGRQDLIYEDINHNVRCV
jgi:hypothetical protein